MDFCLLVWLEVARFFWISMGVGCGRGNRCGCGSSIVVLEFVIAGLVGFFWVSMEVGGRK